MRIPISWLQSYLPKLPPTPELVDLLMMHGLDVDGVLQQGDTYAHVVVGEIVGIKLHPNADKLRLADVVITPNGEPQEVVCGAPNIEVGQKVPVALIGATLPNGTTIEPRAIRGVTSNGMLCAKDELGLGADHSGIFVLDASLVVGTPFGDVVPAETVIDVALPANRSDLMSMRGLAWEIGAMLGQAPKFSPVKLFEGSVSAKESVTVKSTDEQLCSLLTARVIRGVQLVPTPPWMVQRLLAAGMRSVNVIVDSTNYIMLEYGQPLHAYDLSKVHNTTLVARPAQAGESLTTLDGKVRKLTSDTIVIADTDHVIGIAGVMGGEETEVSATTTDIILEAAIFDPVSIRKTSRRLGLISEASKRFEKGLWSTLPSQASTAAAAMIVELCGGTVEQGVVSVGSEQPLRRAVEVRPALIAERLGMKVSEAKCKKILTGLGFVVTGDAKLWMITIPEWRLDVALPEDIVDEVGRMIGYTELPDVVPLSEKAAKDLPTTIRCKEEVKNILVDMGFTEVVSHAFYGDEYANVVQGKHFEIANPLDATQHNLRKSLLPQLDDILQRQADAGRDAMIFEIGLVFDPERKGSVDRQQLWKLAFGVTHKGEEELRATTTALQQQLQSTIQPKNFTVAPKLVRGRLIEYCEFDLQELQKDSKVVFGDWDPRRHIATNVQLREVSKYPAVSRDISFWWPKEEAGIMSTIDAHKPELLQDYSITDHFEKDGKHSYKVNFVYQSMERTLTKAEVDAEEQQMKNALLNVGATIR